MKNTPASCETCPTVCGLRDLASRIEVQIPLAEVEEALLQSQFDAATATSERIQLEQIESEVVYEVLGIRVGEPDPKERVAAVENWNTAFKAHTNGLATSTIRDGRGVQLAADLREQADAVEALCEGPIRGIAIPLGVGVKAFVSLPWGIGKKYCGSMEQNLVRDLTMECADVAIGPTLQHLEGSPTPPQDVR